MNAISPTIINDLGELRPVAMTWTGVGKIKVLLEDPAGQTSSATMTTATMLEFARMSREVLNSNSAQLFRDLGLL